MLVLSQFNKLLVLPEITKSGAKLIHFRQISKLFCLQDVKKIEIRCYLMPMNL